MMKSNGMQSNRKFVIETYRVQVVCRHSQRYAMWCGGCGTNVELASLKEAAEIAGTNTDEIINQAVRGKIHLGVRPEALLFCLHSLLRVKDFFPPTPVIGN